MPQQKVPSKKSGKMGTDIEKWLKEDGEKVLKDESVDMVLLYDVLHPYYFSVNERSKLLREVCRVLKPNALLSVYPEHMGLEEIKRQIEDVNFYFEIEYLKTIIHDDRYTDGRILNFRRPGGLRDDDG